MHFEQLTLTPFLVKSVYLEGLLGLLQFGFKREIRLVRIDLSFIWFISTYLSLRDLDLVISIDLVHEKFTKNNTMLNFFKTICFLSSILILALSPFGLVTYFRTLMLSQSPFRYTLFKQLRQDIYHVKLQQSSFLLTVLNKTFHNRKDVKRLYGNASLQTQINIRTARDPNYKPWSLKYYLDL